MQNIVAEQDDYLVDMLVDLGLINAEQAAKTRVEAQASNVGVVDLLLANKLIRPADVTQAKAAQFGAEVIQLGGIKIPTRSFPSSRVTSPKNTRHPRFKNDNKVAIAIADPSDLNTIDTLTHLLNAEIELRVASEPDIEAALGRYYGGRGTRSLTRPFRNSRKAKSKCPSSANWETTAGWWTRTRRSSPGESNHRGRLQDARLGHSPGTAVKKIPAALPH